MATSWRGAIELAGIAVNVALENRGKSRSRESFKTLGTDGEPIHQVLVESGEFAKLEKDPKVKVATIGRSETSKGVLVGPDEYKALPAAAAETIASVERSSVVEAKAFVPVSTLPLEISTASYVVTPDDKVPGSDKAVGILWNGLLARELAYVTEVTMRAGSRDTILAVYAKADGLYAVALPFAEELANVAQPVYEVDAKAAKAFGKFVDVEVEAFDHEAFTSKWRERRDKAIAAVLAGKEIKAPAKRKPKKVDADLMAALEGATVAAAKRKPKARKKAKAAA